MKQILAVAAFTLMCGSAFAQNTTGPAGQSDNMQKPGVTNGSMEKATKGTTGMNDNMSKDGMKKDSMSKDSMSKDGMKKDDMKK
jgi:pentapeptide MXKDX repeat protein